MFTWLLGIPFLKVITAFLTAAIEVIKPLITLVAEAIVMFVKNFWKGLGVIWDNPSVLTVLVVVFGLGGWYLKTWDNDKVLKECIRTCPNPINQKKYYHPLKRVFKKNVDAVTNKIKKPTATFKPFQTDGGN